MDLVTWASVLKLKLFCTGVQGPTLLSALFHLGAHICLFTLILGTTLRNPPPLHVNTMLCFAHHRHTVFLPTSRAHTRTCSLSTTNSLLLSQNQAHQHNRVSPRRTWESNHLKTFLGSGFPRKEEELIVLPGSVCQKSVRG